jgi:4a-hydroxytetrahydrobiopterin dehydratase
VDIIIDMDLANKKCVPCTEGTESFAPDTVHVYLLDTPGWESVDNTKITRTFKFKNFVEAVSFVNSVADIAESEGHHPDVHITNYNVVTLELTTHKVKGLTENDFILAVKINQLAK